MSMSDPISDMLTRIRNAQMAEKATVATTANAAAVLQLDEAMAAPR